MRLSDLKTGQSATILKVLGHGGFRRRIMEMGFVRGKKVEVVLNAPLRDPIVYKIMDYEVSLRRSEAHMVVVITNEEAEGLISEVTGTTGSRKWTGHRHIPPHRPGRYSFRRCSYSTHAPASAPCGTGGNP